MDQQAYLALVHYERTGCKIKEAVAAVGLAWATFRKALSNNPELKQEYYNIQEWRSEEYQEKALAVGTDANLDPRHARVASDSYRAAAAAYNPRRFGQKLDLNMTQQVSVATALADAQKRVLQPHRNLAPVLDVEAVEVPRITQRGTTDTVSEDAKTPAVDPFS